MGSVRFAKIDVMVSTKKTRGNLRDGLRKKTKDQRDGFSKQSWNLRDGFGAVPGNRGDGFIKIRRDRDDELCQNSRRRTCKRQEKVYETTSASQRNKFDVLRSIESGSEDEDCRTRSSWCKSVVADHCRLGRCQGRSGRSENRGSRSVVIGKPRTSVQGMSFAERILWKRKRKRAEGPLGKLPCMWEDGIYLVSKEPRGSASWRIGVACGSRGLFEGS